METTCELDTGHCHSRRGLLQRGVGPVEVETDIISRLGDGRWEVEVTNQLENETLWVTISKVKARGFEHESLETDDTL